MKNSDFEKMLLASDKTVKKTVSAILNNVGKTIALITATVATLVTFTDISFNELGTESFTSTLILMIISATVLYFSLEDAGQRLGLEDGEFVEIKKSYETAKAKIGAQNIEDFKEYLLSLSLKWRKQRQEKMLLECGLSDSELKDFLSGKQFSKKKERALRKISRIKTHYISAREILSSSNKISSDEIKNPKRLHFVNLCLKIIPSLLCMTVTVSIMLTAKEDLSAASVISGIMKLSTLPIIGLRGYVTGYNFVKEELTLYLESKRRIIEGFISRS